MCVKDSLHIVSKVFHGMIAVDFISRCELLPVVFSSKAGIKIRVCLLVIKTHVCLVAVLVNTTA